MEPYLIHQYHTKVSQNHEDTKNFQILGMDILLDKKNERMAHGGQRQPKFEYVP